MVFAERKVGARERRRSGVEGLSATFSGRILQRGGDASAEGARERQSGKGQNKSFRESTGLSDRNESTSTRGSATTTRGSLRKTLGSSSWRKSMSFFGRKGKNRVVSSNFTEASTFHEGGETFTREFNGTSKMSTPSCMEETWTESAHSDAMGATTRRNKRWFFFGRAEPISSVGVSKREEARMNRRHSLHLERRTSMHERRSSLQERRTTLHERSPQRVVDIRQETVVVGRAEDSHETSPVTGDDFYEKDKKTKRSQRMEALIVPHLRLKKGISLPEQEAMEKYHERLVASIASEMVDDVEDLRSGAELVHTKRRREKAQKRLSVDERKFDEDTVKSGLYGSVVIVEDKALCCVVSDIPHPPLGKLSLDETSSRRRPSKDKVDGPETYHMDRRRKNAKSCDSALEERSRLKEHATVGSHETTTTGASKRGSLPQRVNGSRLSVLDRRASPRPPIRFSRTKRAPGQEQDTSTTTATSDRSFMVPVRNKTWKVGKILYNNKLIDMLQPDAAKFQETSQLEEEEESIYSEDDEKTTVSDKIRYMKQINELIDMLPARTVNPNEQVAS